MINKTFIVKMLRAKHMEYEAMKEIMPKPIKSVVEEMEEETRSIVREIAIAYMKEEKKSDCHEEKMGEEKKTKKVNVEF